MVKKTYKVEVKKVYIGTVLIDAVSRAQAREFAEKDEYRSFSSHSISIEGKVLYVCDSQGAEIITPEEPEEEKGDGSKTIKTRCVCGMGCGRE